jgi:hypothetical protein
MVPPVRHVIWLLAVGLLIGIFRARVVLLERRNRELNKAVQSATKELEQHRGNLEKLVGRRTADLNERIKELRCGYGVSKLIADPGGTVEQVLEKALPLLLSGLNRPDIACARIAFEGGVCLLTSKPCEAFPRYRGLERDWIPRGLLPRRRQPEAFLKGNMN